MANVNLFDGKHRFLNGKLEEYCNGVWIPKTVSAQTLIDNIRGVVPAIEKLNQAIKETTQVRDIDLNNLPEGLIDLGDCPNGEQVSFEVNGEVKSYRPHDWRMAGNLADPSYRNEVCVNCSIGVVVYQARNIQVAGSESVIPTGIRMIP